MIRALATDGGMTLGMLCSGLHMRKRDAKEVLKRMEREGTVVGMASGPGTTYFLADRNGWREKIALADEEATYRREARGPLSGRLTNRVSQQNMPSFRKGRLPVRRASCETRPLHSMLRRPTAPVHDFMQSSEASDIDSNRTWEWAGTRRGRVPGPFWRAAGAARGLQALPARPLM